MRGGYYAQEYIYEVLEAHTLPSYMKLTVALADSGSLKSYSFTKKTDTSNKESEAAEASVIHTAGEGPKKAQTVLFVAKTDRGSLIYARKNGKLFKDEDEIAQLDAQPVGLSIYTSAVTKKSYIVAFSAEGEIFVVDETGDEKGSRKLDHKISAVGVNPKDPLHFAVADPSDFPNIYTTKLGLDASEGKLEFTLDEQWRAKEKESSRVYPPGNNTVSGIVFLPGEETKLVTATSRGVLALYDTSDAKGLPEASVQASKDGIRSIVADPSHPKTVLIGDTRTTVSRWDVEPFKLLGNYKGVSGSTRSLAIRGQYLAVGGLDRYIRVYDIAKRTPAGKVYTGEQVEEVHFDTHDEEEDHHEMDEMWDHIKTKRRRVDRKAAAAKEETEEDVKAELNADVKGSESDNEASDSSEEDSFDDDDEGSEDISEDESVSGTEGEGGSSEFEGFDDDDDDDDGEDEE